MRFRLSSIIIILSIFLIKNNVFSQNTCTTNGTGDWDNASTWICDSGVGNPPDGIWSNGYYAIVNHNIQIPNNVIIDLSGSNILELRLNANLTFGSNSKLILPSGCQIIVAPGAVISTTSNSQGTLIEIGGNGVWGRGCEGSGCSNGDLTGPGIIDENSDPAFPLPVELLSFTAKTQDNSAILYWSTASELNNDFFTIEKSKNGKEFEFLAKVAGNGTSHTRIDYSFTDKNPNLGLSYYRLRQTDYDGTTEVFPAISLLYSNSKNISVYPNPIDGQSTRVRATGKQNNAPIVMNIYNLQGKIMIQKNFISDSFGNLDEELVLGNVLERGTYILELVSPNQKDYIKISRE